MKNEKHEYVEKLVELVKDVKTAMLITNVKAAGNLSGRPMGINKIDDDGTMWFFTKASSYKIDELLKDNQVSLAIQNDSEGIYLMINGSAELSFDKAKMKELWNPIMKVWFAKGLEDPDMALIKVTPTEANYWDSSANSVVVVFNMLKAVVTGKEYNEGEHGFITL